MGESVITDETRALIGKPLGNSYVAGEVDRSSVQKFVTAIGNPNPLWTDESYAKGTPMGGCMAPPTFIISISPQATLPDGSSPNEA
ncbi:MAG: MaoC family dehydratase N-terminal domain-containing protein [SAR202 cluster bacterium]|nr:MaoC family dehydratase N-terminal domain-containing protein [SAR202 cluster bacterium]MDP6299831.1 MaoC family dehydratase N-terminal domain-containing protein [SAR202 cluster bacterium]MDP7102566.1 MaoC family dehydratase N-terminal domain-containing protein [SAR202 cluster bacterium]MDP7223896.1 MaoC family dehydratase N-terminal domain-containing protein [SAR202 cluster bacterium]MDP7413248.1 MaoC family dehydratase N-terminal domain-containing protein [SAR202 cluster bacterium]|tara:strand:- start:7899 stop:8156 length:258 start_codon:yes stop_codon:yes gene_type:complete